MADEARGLKGFGKMGSKYESKPAPKEAAPKEGKKDEPAGVEGEGDSQIQTHTVERHPDGHLVSKLHDGTETEHPDHMHMLAHLGHHMTGGDKHHIAHHDGMEVHSHGIHEDGQHDGPHSHGSGMEAGQHMGQFMDGQGGGEQMAQEGEPEQEPAYGGM
jgi:hypothetical protein